MNLTTTAYLQELENYDKAIAAVHIYDIYHYRTDRIPVSWKDCDTDRTENGYNLKIKCPKHGVAFDIEIRMETGRLKIRIPYKSVTEEKTYYWRLEGVEILPEFMAQPYGADGYLLWPNYSGVSCRFDKTEAVEFRDIIYGADNRWENFTSMPVFGKVGGDAGFLCIISGGQFACELVHRLAKGTDKMHSTTPLFRFRMDPRQKIDDVDRVLKYIFFEGEKNNFVEMAKTYRQFLQKERGILSLKQKCRDNDILKYAAGSQWLKIFCGDKECQYDGQGRFRTWTTFAQAKEVLQALLDRGIDKITCMLVGWNQEGHDGRYPDRLPPEPRLGGEAEMKKLVQWGKARGLQMTVHDNYVDSHECAEHYDENGMMRNHLGFIQVVGIWSGGESHRLKHEFALQDAKRDLPVMRDEIGVSGMYYLDAVSLGLEPDFSDLNNIRPRRDFALGQLAILDETRKFFGCVQIENSLDYTFNAADACASVITLPYRTEYQTDICRSMNDFLPFFHIAWHGSILYHHTDLMQFVQAANQNPYRLILQELSWGALGRIELTYKESLRTKGFACIKDDKILDMVGQQYNLLNKKAAYLQFEFIENYEQIDTECFMTTYSDGSEITVDYQTMKCRIIDGKGEVILDTVCSDLQLNQPAMV